ncbi:hypothetical protein [Saccharothrix australiensis]|uniref:Uncharacterized protein n=1 Tax=Saccharothrix australiensis TaxID=2072 RepID=A0A495VXR4_9PSEU|nr:hypothetical protein [Saccharothrix australiensis]RKT54116.1 hypothetical protein C8E97_2717 [Saccharothrix australiensis]
MTWSYSRDVALLRDVPDLRPGHDISLGSACAGLNGDATAALRELVEHGDLTVTADPPDPARCVPDPALCVPRFRPTRPGPTRPDPVRPGPTRPGPTRPGSGH